MVAWAEELDSPSSPVRIGAKGVEPRVVASATVPAGTGQSVSEATALPPPASVGSGRPVAEVPVVSTSEPKLMLEAKAAVFVPPPEDSVLVHARGDQGLAAVVTSEAGKAVGRFGLKRIRKVLKEGDVLPQVAAVELVVTTRELGSRELSFYGKRSVATTVSLTAELIQTAEGEVLAGPVTEQVEYTTLNRDANVREAVGRLMRKLQKDRDTE